MDFALGLRGPPTKITIFSSWTFFRKVPCLLVFGSLFFIFGPTFFSFLVGRFFDLGSAGIRIWAPGMFPYGEVSVKRFFSKCEILEKKSPQKNWSTYVALKSIGFLHYSKVPGIFASFLAGEIRPLDMLKTYWGSQGSRTSDIQSPKIRGGRQFA